ncbi:hypothetical protein [Bacillus safensis]|uniref:hypothetical protein n=1 Tax=Bacillus safensis TaxID=561879 RepID=UPI0021E594DA|nr:hypothetical protein [Bacillus safensis]UXO88736.1 hypothetical protein N7921_03275 [Bacillus safensis]
MNKYVNPVMLDVVAMVEQISSSQQAADLSTDHLLTKFNDILEIVLINRHGETLKLEAYELNYEVNKSEEA